LEVRAPPPSPPIQNRAGENAIWMLAAVGPGDIRSYDFMSSRTEDGRPLRGLNVVHDYTRIALAVRCAADHRARCDR
jgi:hypothetical protein